MKNVALITGASSGIGEALARYHAKRGGDLILIARRQDRLEQLKAEVERQFPSSALIIVQDLARLNAPEEIYQQIRGHHIKIDYLINNAGFGGYGKFYEREWDDDRRMIQLNIVTLAALTRLFLPEMIERGRGRILNVASMAGFVPGPLQSVYYASKAFVLSFSEALANELEGTGVSVTAFCPGSTRTEFAAMADVLKTKAFQGRLPTAKDVARDGYEAMLRGKPVEVPGMGNKIMMHLLLRLLPRSLVTKISRARMERFE